MNKPSPGLPLRDSPVDSNLNEDLYQLDYMKSNVVKHKLLRMPSGVNKDQVVDLAKEYCKSKYCTFLWVEKAIAVIEQKEI